MGTFSYGQNPRVDTLTVLCRQRCPTKGPGSSTTLSSTTSCLYGSKIFCKILYQILLKSVVKSLIKSILKKPNYKIISKIISKTLSKIINSAHEFVFFQFFVKKGLPSYSENKKKTFRSKIFNFTYLL